MSRLPMFDRTVPDALRCPEPTANKRVRAWAKAKAQRPTERVTGFALPPLDVASLQRKYGPERAGEPRPFQATFRAKTDTPARIFENMAHAATGKWISIMSKKGWDLASDVRVRPGVYPVQEINTNAVILGEREFIISALFRHQAPKPVRIEVPREWREPVWIGRN